MTAKTPKDEDPDIIEGVAVEKSAPSGRRGRSGGKTGSSRRKPAAESSDAADQASASAAPDAASLSTGPGLPLVISIAALLLVLAVAGYQIWQAGRSDAALRAEMAAMAGHLDEARDGMALLRQEIDAARAGQAGRGARVDSVEAALPVDPSAELAALSSRLGKMEDAARTAKRSAASGSTDARSCSPRTLPPGTRSVCCCVIAAALCKPPITSTHHAGRLVTS